MSTIFLTDIITEIKKRKSYGIVAYTLKPFRILLAHPGGPEHRYRKEGWWGIPKGRGEENESPWSAACREFKEETGLSVPKGIRESDVIDLGTIVQRNKKIVRAWAVQMEDDDISGFRSNTFKMKWPPNDPHAKEKSYPEVDEIRYFTYADAARHIRYYQLPLLDRLFEILNKAFRIRENKA